MLVQIAKKQQVVWSKKIGFLLAFLIIVGLSGCAKIFGEKSPSLITKNVKVQLKWLHQAQFAGMYVADQKGYYIDQGLDVELIPFDYRNYPIDLVVTGKAEFGVAGADELVMAKSQGMPVKALAVIFQSNPTVAFVRKDSGISSLEDFKGKKIGIENSNNIQMIIKSMLSNYGLEAQRDYELVEIGFDAQALVDKQVDVSTGYVINEPFDAMDKGVDVKIFEPERYGVEIYADVLFTTDDLINKEPELVRGFVQATIKGWEEAVENIDEGARMTILYEGPNGVDLNFEYQRRMLDSAVPLIKPTRGLTIGDMSFTRWKQTYDILHKFGYIENEFSVNDLFTKRFLD